jgi:hypothetical protein
LEGLARSLISEGIGQLELYRQLAGYLAHVDPGHPREEPLQHVIDRVWGGSWAEGRALFELPLDGAASMSARAEPYTVHRVVAALKELDGRVVQVAGFLELLRERNALWHDPPSERGDLSHSSLWVNSTFHCHFRPSPEIAGRQDENPPWSWTSREITPRIREVALWIREQFSLHRVSVIAVVDARDKGHLGGWPGSRLLLSVARVSTGDGLPESPDVKDGI